MSYNKMTKKELLEICEKLKLTSYKTKNKPELIKIIEESNKGKYIIEEIVEFDNDIKSDNESDDELKVIPIIKNNVEIKKSNNKKNDDVNTIICGIENIVIETSEQIQKKKYERKLDELYKVLHNANMKSLNLQFKYRSQYPIIVYNNLEMLKKRINVYNV